MKIRKWDVLAYPRFIVVSIKILLLRAKTGFIDGRKVKHLLYYPIKYF